MRKEYIFGCEKCNKLPQDCFCKSYPCPDCKGEGYSNCGLCDGSGYVRPFFKLLKILEVLE